LSHAYINATKSHICQGGRENKLVYEGKNLVTNSNPGHEPAFAAKRQTRALTGQTRNRIKATSAYGLININPAFGDPSHPAPGKRMMS
jgi:hypothetical protein